MRWTKRWLISVVGGRRLARHWISIAAALVLFAATPMVQWRSCKTNENVCVVSLFVFVFWQQQCVLCEINRYLDNKQLNGTIPSSIGQLTLLQNLWVTITIRSFSLCLCSWTAVSALWNPQSSQQQPAEWHDSVLDRTINCAHSFVSDDYNCLVVLSLFSCSCADNSSVCFVKSTDISTATSWLARSRPLSDNWPRYRPCEWRLLFSHLRCLSVRVRMLITAVFALL